MERLLENLFLDVLNMSITASYIIPFVILIRLFLKKVPKIYSYSLWSVVLFRLICPVSFSSNLNIMQFFGQSENTEYIPSTIGLMAKPQVDTGIKAVDASINASLPAPIPYASANPMQIIQFILTCAWLIGVAVLLLYGIVSFIKLNKKVFTSVRIQDNIYESTAIASPFVLGYFRPKIYLPTGTTEAEQNYIIQHEQTHIKRWDPLIKLIAFLALCLHWFNPLVWVSFVLMTKDMEMSCDESVVKKLGTDIKKEYSSTLLSLAMKPTRINMIPLAFGESNVKARIKNILNYRKPKLWVGIIIAAVCIGVLIAGASNPIDHTSSSIEDTALTKQLYDNRTAYVGNSSKVITLIDALPLPDGISRGEIILNTDTPPYGISIHYATSEDSVIPNEVNFFRNSALLFATIDNADTITHIGHWGGQALAALSSSKFIYSYTRTEIENVLGLDLKEYGQSTGKLAALTAILNQTNLSEVSTVPLLTEPVWSAEQSVGADMASLDYASDHTIIFHGYFGLYIYDLDSQRMIRSLDLKVLGCDATQGDNYCEVSVSRDGDTIQLHPMSSAKMFIYTVSDNRLIEAAYKELKDSFQAQLVPIETVLHSKFGNYSVQAVVFDTGEYGFLHTSDWTLGTLSYVRDDMTYALFQNQ
ncbi:M56 family metallopeptidase [Clostridium aminobutyricum]|uniref:DUF4825 domain-containing protein n=1 Tax=Clostridium aminobutyricum TaxID=33953 RepID=A0A939IHT0_CLOAM|nr:M56 family metallopeptidase [Clostridium aminobutyricum]MBN7771779.1 DUF4825 domain-containing protein [Clostridium aminobutyricum]